MNSEQLSFINLADHKSYIKYMLEEADGAPSSMRDVYPEIGEDLVDILE